jgi:predicted porin
MKKSLLALAAIGAFASAAQAQSSVTVYGIIDAGVIGGTNRASLGGAATGTTANAGTTGVIKSNGIGANTAGESTGRIGFKGTEDLGGGTSALFTYEIAVDPNATTLTTTTRQAFVGLKKNGIGSGLIGSQNTVIYDAVIATDPSGINNMGGNLITVSTKGPQSGSSILGTPVGTGINTQGLTNNIGYNTRVSNALQFKSDDFAGFKARLMYVLNNANATQTTTGGAGTGVGGVKNVSGGSAALDYTWHKLYLTANYQAFNASSNGNAQSTTPIMFGVGTDGMTGSTVSAGTNVRDVGQYYAANYDFGILKATAQYVNRKASTDSAPSYYTKYTAQQIGVTSYVTPAVQVWASAAVGKYQPMATFVASGTPFTPGISNLNGFQVGSNYWLSKRTNLYAIYGQMAQSNQQTTATSNTNSYNFNNYAVGVRHTF